jgi:membrane protease YdiL (CAAX protease family)
LIASIMSEDLRKDPAIAPPWHTAALVTVILAVAVTGTLLSREKATHVLDSPIATAYLPAIVVSCGLSAYVCRVGRARSALAFLLGKPWTWMDVLIAGALSLFVRLSYAALGAGASSAMAPAHTIAERLIWILVALSVGVSEELVYRGYLQKQLGAFTGRASLGVILQACLFAIAHANQGARGAAIIGVYGLVFGIVAAWRESLAAVILCHVAIDMMAM